MAKDGQPSDITKAYAGKLMPIEQVVTFATTEQIFPSRTISRGAGPIKSISKADRQIDDLHISGKNENYDLFDYVSRNRLVGLMIVKDGQAMLEHYDQGLTPATRWMSMSMAKSVATTLVGCAIKDGLIQDVDEPLVTYLPQLKGGGYEPVSIRHLMQMTSGVDWDDTHTDSASHRRHMLALQIAQRGGAILDYMAERTSIAKPGTRWNYSTGETHVVGALLKAATGKWLSDYFSEKIWSRIGAEHDAAWWLEAPDGLEVAGSGICATLRDYCRFGLFALSGKTPDGEMVVPSNWLKEATSVRSAGDEPLPYGYMWWPVPDLEGSFDEGAFSARGIFGQYIYINPTRDIVITTLSARAKPLGSEVILDNDFFNAVVEEIG